MDTYGITQAEKMSELLEQFPIRAVYSSPYQRAIETATPFAQRAHLPVTILESLHEINFGNFDGMGEEFQNQPVWQQFLSHPATVQFPNGESVTKAQKRIVAALDQLADYHAEDEHILCVSHCEIIRLALAYALCISTDEYMRLSIDTASISCVQWNKTSGSVYKSGVRQPSIEHLAQSWERCLNCHCPVAEVVFLFKSQFCHGFVS